MQVSSTSSEKQLPKKAVRVVLNKLQARENSEVYDFMKGLVVNNRDNESNPKMSTTHTQVKKRFKWSKMNSEGGDVTSLW